MAEAPLLRRVSMTSSASVIAVVALVGMSAAPAAAQYQQTYPQQPYPGQTVPQSPYQGYGQNYPGQAYPGEGYPGQGYGNEESAVGAVVDTLIGNRYAGGDRQAIRQCAWAAVQRARGQYGGNGYGQGYGPHLRVTSITDVQRRTLVLRVRGTLGRGGGYGNGYGNNGYGNNGYGNNGYGSPGYGGEYARPEFNFRCDVNYQGNVQDVRLDRLNRGY